MTRNKNLKIFLLFLIASSALVSCLKKDANPAIGTPGELISLFQLRNLYAGSDVTISGNNVNGASKIEGVVISDKSGNNLDPNMFVIQQTLITANSFTDVTRGLAIKLNSPSTFSVGDSVRITVTGSKLVRINGMLTISGVAAEKVEVITTGRTPFSRPVTTGLLQEKFHEYEGTLVTLHADAADAGQSFSGLHELKDHTGGQVYLYTLTGSALASSTLPLDAQFGGIAGYYKEGGNDTSGAKRVIIPRNTSDVQYTSGILYPGFPESFEVPDASTKSSYNSGTNIIALSTGNWYLLQGILANTPGSDRYNIPGKQSVRMQQNLTTSGYLQMNFDLPDGASKVTAFYGRYSTDAKSSFRLEYSTNGGTTWTTAGSTIVNDADKLMKQATWMLNITGNVRFRINKLGTGTSSNGRLNIDDFAVYKK